MNAEHSVAPSIASQLPRLLHAPSPQQGSASPTSSGPEPAHLQEVPTISIVDDDPSVRVAMDSLVRSLGYAARTFACAAEFLQSPHVASTACVIADVAMPGMTGIEMQDALIEEGYRLPIIFITAFPKEPMRKRALDAGAVCFLSKPFAARSMIDCLDAALEGRAAP
jgi:FixJ family two-component response regulator